MGPHCLCKSRWRLKRDSLLGVVQGFLLLVLGSSLLRFRGLLSLLSRPSLQTLLTQLLACLCLGLNNESPESPSVFQLPFCLNLFSANMLFGMV